MAKSKRADNLDLQLRRRRLGIHQDKLAAELDVHSTTLSRFETGKRADLPGGRGRAEVTAAIDRLAEVVAS